MASGSAGNSGCETSGLVRATMELSQGSVRANGGSGSGCGDQRRLVATLVTAKARKCRGRLRQLQGQGCARLR